MAPIGCRLSVACSPSSRQFALTTKPRPPNAHWSRQALVLRPPAKNSKRVTDAQSDRLEAQQRACCCERQSFDVRHARRSDIARLPTPRNSRVGVVCDLLFFLSEPRP
ncbi:hypothetical protein BGZ60DRAFT_416477, partial [Tricladium varicosporioides]